MSKNNQTCISSLLVPPFKAIPDEMSPEEILAQARSAASRAKRNLDTAQKKVRVGFLRKKEKGEIAFAVTEDKFRVKAETPVDSSNSSSSSLSFVSSRRDEKPHLHNVVKPFSSSSSNSSASNREDSVKEDAFDLFDNRKRFLKEMSASLKPKEKPIDKVSKAFNDHLRDLNDL